MLNVLCSLPLSTEVFNSIYFCCGWTTPAFGPRPAQHLLLLLECFIFLEQILSLISLCIYLTICGTEFTKNDMKDCFSSYIELWLLATTVIHMNPMNPTAHSKRSHGVTV